MKRCNTCGNMHRNRNTGAFMCVLNGVDTDLRNTCGAWTVRIRKPKKQKKEYIDFKLQQYKD